MNKKSVFLGLTFFFGLGLIGSFFDNSEDILVIQLFTLVIFIFFTYKYFTVEKTEKKENYKDRTEELVCAKCENNNISYQVINEVEFKRKGRGCLYWLIIGWWLEILLWFFLTIPRLLFLLFGGKRQKAINLTKKMAVCQNCGYSWKV